MYPAGIMIPSHLTKQGSPYIIIVDDEASAREMVGEYLKMHGKRQAEAVQAL